MKMTMADIAKIAGVSGATVSRVINNKAKGVSEETRQRIWKIIEENNFQPNAVARGLATRSSKIIGLVIPDITNPYYPKIAKGIEVAAAERGYTTILCDAENKPEKEAAYLKFLNEHYVSGIIFNNFREVSESTLKLLSTNSLPTIFVDSRLDLPHSKNVFIDNMSAMEQVVHYLYDLGHKKIAFVGGAYNSYSTVERLKGYKSALYKLNLPFDEKYIFYGDYEVDEAEKIGYEFIESKSDATAIACCSDVMSIGIYKAFSKLGVRIPEDVSIVSFDDIDMASLLSPALTTVRQPSYEMGKESAKMLIELIENSKSRSGRDMIFKAELVARDSVKKMN